MQLGTYFPIGILQVRQIQNTIGCYIAESTLYFSGVLEVLEGFETHLGIAINDVSLVSCSKFC
jgi:hypothetical protein